MMTSRCKIGALKQNLYFSSYLRNMQSNAKNTKQISQPTYMRNEDTKYYVHSWEGKGHGKLDINPYKLLQGVQEAF